MFYADILIFKITHLLACMLDNRSQLGRESWIARSIDPWQASNLILYHPLSCRYVAACLLHDLLRHTALLFQEGIQHMFSFYLTIIVCFRAIQRFTNSI